MSNKRSRIPKAASLIAVDEIPDTELCEQGLGDFDPEDGELDYADEDLDPDDLEDGEEADPDEQPDSPVATGPDALDQYLHSVHDAPVTQHAPPPSKREPRGDDEFKVQHWPGYDTGQPLGRLAHKFHEAGIELPETMTRRELLSAGVNVKTNVQWGYLLPLSPDNPERPFLTTVEFAQRFLDKSEKDAVRRLEAVFTFLRNPYQDPLIHEIPSPIKPDYLTALVDTLTVTPACLKVLLEEADKARPATQDTALQLLARDPSQFAGKVAKDTAAMLVRMVQDDWDADTIQLLLDLLGIISPSKSADLLMALRLRQNHSAQDVRETAIRQEYSLFME